MPKAKNAVSHRRKVKKILKQARGYSGSRSKLYRSAKEAVMRALSDAYRDRRRKKREFRRLWITRINAGIRPYGLNYSQLIHGLKLAEIHLNRKVLATIALEEPLAFEKIVHQVKKTLEQQPSK